MYAHKIISKPWSVVNFQDEESVPEVVTEILSQEPKAGIENSLGGQGLIAGCD
jgi:hypothetical protein